MDLPWKMPNGNFSPVIRLVANPVACILTGGLAGTDFILASIVLSNGTFTRKFAQPGPPIVSKYAGARIVVVRFIFKFFLNFDNTLIRLALNICPTGSTCVTRTLYQRSRERRDQGFRVVVILIVIRWRGRRLSWRREPSTGGCVLVRAPGPRERDAGGEFIVQATSGRLRAQILNGRDDQTVTAIGSTYIEVLPDAAQIVRAVGVHRQPADGMARLEQVGF